MNLQEKTPGVADFVTQLSVLAESFDPILAIGLQRIPQKLCQSPSTAASEISKTGVAWLVAPASMAILRLAWSPVKPHLPTVEAVATGLEGMATRARRYDSHAWRVLYHFTLASLE